MVYTVTFNPAVDYVVSIDDIRFGEVNRSLSEQLFFGGKGINVSAVLSELGIESVALGFTAGYIGEAIEKGVADMHINADFVRLGKGNSRINLKLRSDLETEINCQGPEIDSRALDALFEKLARLTDGDVLVLAGSIPSSLPADIYERILQRVSDRSIMTVVDATKALLLNVLKYKPFLIKPNNHELEELFGEELPTVRDIERCAMKLREMGAQNVLVSMAGDGALLVDSSGKTHFCGACKGTVRNSVGAGDSMVAGFLAGILGGPQRCGGFDYEYALRLGTAAGGATAFSDGLAKKHMIDELLGQL